MDRFFLPLTKKERLAVNTWRFFFDSSNFPIFSPGQFSTVTLPIKPTDELGNYRDFTISSSPTEKGYIAITTKIGKSDFKKTLLSLKVGTVVTFSRPSGGFILDKNQSSPVVFLAGGIGITPFRSMVVYGHNKNLKVPLTLFASFSHSEDMIFYNELCEIANQNQNLKIVFTITKPAPQWDGEKGRISEKMIRSYIPAAEKALYMVTGSVSMVDSMVTLLQSMGVAQNNIRIEYFTGY